MKKLKIIESLVASSKNALSKRSLVPDIDSNTNDKLINTFSLENAREELQSFYDYHYNQIDQDYVDLYRFLKFLLQDNDLKPKNLTHGIDNNLNNTHLTNQTQIDSKKIELDILPVALIQVFVVISVFLILFLMCKCNRMLEACRDRALKSKTTQQLEEDNYNEKMTFKDYVCFLWYSYRMKRRFKKRRIRNQRFKKRIARKNGIRERSNSSNRTTNIRNNSLIFKRNSVVHRNRVYSSLKFKRNQNNSLMTQSSSKRSRRTNFSNTDTLPGQMTPPPQEIDEIEL